MKLSTNLWLEKGFYIDIDHLGQLRIVGPGDHFYFGMINEKEKRRNYEITKIFSKKGNVFIKGYFFGPKAKFSYPVMGDVRTVRTYIYEGVGRIRSFYEIRKKFSDVLLPNKISENKKDGEYIINFERHFGEHFYGSELILEDHIKVLQKDSCLVLSADKTAIHFTLRFYSNIFLKEDFPPKPFSLKDINFNKFNDKKDNVKRLLSISETEVKHLLRYRKTSGLDYGTIFPRDWTETAMLGYDDFSKDALHYIIRESLKYVDKKGAGWHEGGVGEFAYNRALSHLPLIDRDMIDIEPRYILTFGMFPEIFTEDNELLQKIQRVASFVLAKAKRYSFIQFAEHPECRSFKAGNWRDSSAAYLHASSCIIPYDTNAVFYPAALKVMQKFSDILKIKGNNVQKVVTKWQDRKDLFKFKNKDDMSGYALALYSFKNEKNFQKLGVNHTDEAYDLIFGHPEEDDVLSFAERVSDPEYFYTKSGPLIVGRKDGYKSYQYHGEVIWLKQFGLCSMGLRKQLERKDFSKETKDLIKEAIKYLFNSLIYTFDYLDLLPELIIDKNGAPFLYNNQKNIEGHMNKIQLWSAESARRVVFDYYDVILKA